MRKVDLLGILAVFICKMRKSSLAAGILVLFILALGDDAQAQAVRWRDTGRMRLGRASHTATLLNDGRVLIVGGCTDAYCDPATVSAELYEPATGAWTDTGRMRTARYSHTATLLSDGRVLVVGRSATAELFDPETGIWTVTGNVRVVRFDHTATLLNDGRVLVTGGCIQAYCSPATATAELYDPAIGAWTDTGRMRTARYNHTATLLTDGKVLVVGGGGGASAPATAEVYDPETGTWTNAGSMRLGRSSHSATLLDDGNVLVAGGCPQANCGYQNATATAELFDPATRSWTATGDMRDARRFHTATLLTNGHVVVAGSFLFGGEGDWPQLNTAEEYDPAKGTWASRTMMRTGRSSHTATPLNGGTVLVAGGVDFISCVLECPFACYLDCRQNVAATAEIYDASIELPLTIITTGLPNGTVDSTYSSRVRSSDGRVPVTWDVTIGALPPGLVLNPGSGQISGTPTTAGTFDFIVRATDSSFPQQTATQPLSITIRPALGIDITALPSGAVHCRYTATLRSSGGTPPITWSITSGVLPAGLVLNSASGQISGTPTAPGTFDFTVRAIDTSSPPQTPTQPLSIVVDETTRVACWGDTGRMTGERAAHTAILLPDGRVFVTGSPAPDAELYDPATGIWTRTSQMSVRRSGHSATLLQDGRVLVAGGRGSAAATAELYDPATGTWVPTGNMNSGRDTHAATLLHDGRVLVSGGWFNPSAELYDPSTGTWAPTGSMGVWRVGHTATLLNDGKVLVLGGEIPGELYDPSTGTWTWTSGQGHTFHSAALLPDGRVLVVGGCCGFLRPTSAELYDPATGIWTATGSTRVGHRIHTATLLADGKVLVAGGDPSVGWLGESVAELYDPSTGTWTDTASLITGRWQHAAALLSDGSVLVTGGAVQGAPGIDTVYTATSEVYLPAP